MKTLNALVWREGKWFVAKSLEIEVASQGKTKSEALKNLREAIELYLEGEDLDKISLPKVQKPEISKVYV